MSNELKHDTRQHYFITLTYNEHHYKNKNNHRIKPINYEYKSEPPNLATEKLEIYKHKLKKPILNNFQKFIKKLRTKYKHEKISYIALGEYGEIGYRAHYHAILLMEQIPDLEQITTNTGNSHQILKLGKYGNIQIQKIEPGNIKYICNHKTIKTKNKWQSQSKDIGKKGFSHLKNNNLLNLDDGTIINKNENENAKQIPATPYIRYYLKKENILPPEPQEQKITTLDKNKNITKMIIQNEQLNQKKYEKIRKRLNNMT